MARRFPGGAGLAAILALALVLRVVLVLAQPDLQPLADAGDYDRHAKSIAAGDGFPETLIADPGGPTALRPPAYPYLLGAVYAVTGDSFTAGRLAGALLGVLTVWLVFVLGARLFDRRTGLIAAAIAAVFPPLVWLNSSVLSEQLFLPLELGAVAALLRAREGGARWAALAGVLIGLGALTRVVGLALLLPAVLARFARRRAPARPGLPAPPGAVPLRARLGAPALAVACAALVIAPWTIRNAVEFGRFVPVATQDGFNLYGTYNERAANFPGFPAGFVLPLALPESAGLFRRPGTDEADIARELGGRARDYVADHPLYPLKVVYWSTRRLVDVKPRSPATEFDYRQTGVSEGAEPLLRISVWLLVLAAVAGAVLARSRLRPLWVWSVPVLMWLGVVIFLGYPRYRAPIDPFLILLAAAAGSAGMARRARSGPSARG